VVQEHTAPTNGRFVEVVGNYQPTATPKIFEVKEDRIQHWISVGAKPSDTVASLLKRNGFKDMDQYIEPKNKKATKKKEDK